MMFSFKTFQRPVAAVSIALCLAAVGCTKEQRAIDAAKKDVTTTGQPEEVIYVDHAGNTTVTMVSAPAPGSSAPTVVQTVSPAGAQQVAGLPDWSNGMHPPLRHVARYKGPGMMVAPPTESEPGAAVDPNAQTYNGNVATVADTNNYAASGPIPPPPANYAPANVTLAAGTGLAIRINQRIDVKHAVAGQRFSGQLAESVSNNGNVVLPRGTEVHGVVDEAHRRGHFKGRSFLELRLTSLVYNGQTYPLETRDFVATKKGKGKRSAAFIGGGAGVGMLIGGIATGGVGMAVGGLAGGGLGTVLAGATGNRDVVIPAESLVRFKLEDDLTVQPAVAANGPVNGPQRGY